MLQFAGRELSGLGIGTDHRQGREPEAGIINVKGSCPDCGFGWSPRYMRDQKIPALAASAVLARKELAGQT